MKTSRGLLVLLLLLAAAFSLGTWLQPHALRWATRSQSDSLWKMLLGDSRRMFANHFFIKADIAFHSGYYPSIFDQAWRAEEQENAMANKGEHQREGQETGTEGGFMGPPTDWIDRFGRHFRVTTHTHLQGSAVREILPWLRVSADLDPHRIETYTTTAYWLRSSLGRVDEAERFLREGLKANPDSYEILFELGCVSCENHHDVDRARNLWKLALRRWQEKEQGLKDPNVKALDQILMHLGHLEEQEGHWAEAIRWLELAKPHSPNPDAVQKQIDGLRAKLSAAQTQR